MTEPTQPTKWSLILILIAVAAAIVAIVPPLMYASHVGWAIVSAPEAWNNFGTFVGGVLGPVLSAFSFFGLLVTVYFTQKQLALAREAKIATDAAVRDQLALAHRTRRDAERAAAAQLKLAIAAKADSDKAAAEQLQLAKKSQADAQAALQMQQRDAREEAARSNFFEMVRLHHEIVGGLSVIGKDGHERSGRSVIRGFMFDIFAPAYTVGVAAFTEAADVMEFDREFCSEIFKKQGERFAHYFRNLRVILVYIESGPYEDREQLREILRAQLSDDELLMIFYYCLGRPFGNFLKHNVILSGMFKMFDLHHVHNEASLNAFNPLAWGRLQFPYRWYLN